MENLEVYNLEKLKWVLWGMAIPMIVNIIRSFFDGIIALEIVNSLIDIIGCIILILGLKSISIYSNRFRKAYNCNIFIIIICFILIIAFSIGIVMPRIFTLVALVGVIAIFAIIGIEICFYYSLIKGIEEISRKLGENRFADKIENFWYKYVWTIILTVMAAFIFLIAFSKFIIVLNIIFVIILSVLNTMLLVYIYKSYKLLNGREIPSECVSYNEKESEDAKLE